MRQNFITVYRRLLKSTNFPSHRYLFNSFNLNNRLTGLVGSRGTGKTTLLLQYIKENIQDKQRTLYVSLDNIYFSHRYLLDFVDEFYEIEGVRNFFFDEVHKYANWAQELKNIYDSYPDVKVVFSGSSSIDLVRGTYDLSRRGVLFRLSGVSFREYLEFKLKKTMPVFAFHDVVKNPQRCVDQLQDVERLRGHFIEYLENGYYPFLFEDEGSYHEKIINIINKTIFEDISSFYKLKTENLDKFKKILAYMTTIPPGELNRNSIAKHIGLDHKTIEHYLNILNETGLVCLLQEDRAGSNLLKGCEKIYLDNTNIYKAISKEIGFDYHLGTAREIFFIKMLQNAGENIFYSKIGDFKVQGYNFEVGGRSKSGRQIRHDPEFSYLVKDDTLYPGNNSIPLYLFGFLY